MESVLGSSYEQQISLSWREPLNTYGRIRTYEVRRHHTHALRVLTELARCFLSFCAKLIEDAKLTEQTRTHRRTLTHNAP